MSDPMAEIKASFFIECEELLESLMDALQSMSDGQSDSETINVAFRAVHSIKGGAGAFALDELVDFAHHFETAMDDVRSDRLALDSDLIDLFFRCGDILSDLVRAAREDEASDRSVIDPVVEALKAASGITETDGANGEAEPEFQPLTLELGDLDLPPIGDDADFDAGLVDLPDVPDLPPLDAAVPAVGVTIRFKPDRELYESGNEPLFLLRSLADLGSARTRLETTLPSTLPTTPAMAGLLTWIIEFDTAVEQSAIEEVFEFVSGLCTLDIQTGSTPVADTTPSPDTIEDLASELGLDEAPAAAPLPNPEPPVETTKSEPEVMPAPAIAKEESAPQPPSRSAPPKQAAAPSATVRVDLARIDRLVNLVGELVINQSMLSQSVIESDLPPNSAISTGLDEFLQLTRDIQESVMMIRAQPVKSLFQRMSRIVREASAAVGKKVALNTDGEGTEIDKTVIERLADPLTHMIRNAVDHGLESTEDRVRAGKSETGQVRLIAMHRSGRVVIEISDDGGGINRPKVRQIAIDKGLIPADAQLNDGEIDQLLFMPGFSTADQVSNLSGRGVGMDVVKNAIAALGGQITIQSTPGEGTTFSISLPLTLAVQDGMVVRVENETLVMPLSAIAETLTLKNDDVRLVGPTSRVVLVRETFVPLLDLGVELGYRPPREDYGGAIALLVGQDDASKAALVVDAIDDQRQVVIKGLQDSYGSVPGVAAATILGDGQIALILDASDLVQNAVGRTRSTAYQEAI